ncbi:mitochondrial substrate carrier family protein [Basidiobolus meristosporus CBS 931.73]|uniref:Mitochondrial substrate carrier family protein n=1 Tax=Basidiobolus meristosporus CBS 931.73 TaxID=1314790 RepID=A0A1Y1WZG0_9FUNG|nr:mitochondrial substrate carrier family protein [Basidiobolus meristosporus CBS 931.73]|eukprot:ORX78949.1 mitochondrial substrate carrier family protein [Basidiobolus meristosporus CBS 931.73]
MPVPDSAKDFIAGTFGGWAQVVAGHPFDTLKVRLQTQGNPPKYNGGMDCLRITLKEEGLAGLYRGVTSPLAGIGFCNAVVFSANGYFRRMLQGGEAKPLTLSQIAVAGGLAGSVMSFINCPVELLKVKLQVQSNAVANGVAGAVKPYSGVFDCGVRTFSTYGIRGLYRGITITILRDIPSFAAYFGFYEALKASFSNTFAAGRELNGFELLLAGGTAGIGCWTVCYPQDVIKSRMQNDRRSSYKSFLDCAAKLNAESGYRAFFRGFGPTMARAFPANAATLWAYEMAMKWMNSTDDLAIL